MVRSIFFVTGTRADFGKQKKLMLRVHEHPNLRCIVFATGMHMLNTYGFTVEEIRRLDVPNLIMYTNQVLEEPMERALGNTITGLSRVIEEFRPDLIVVHGDRLEAFAGAIVGALSNVRVAHLEGGEVSGTIDESMRHAISKLAHVHLVTDERSRKLLLRLGEEDKRIFVVGSLEADAMRSPDLPDLGTVKQHYAIGFERYGICIVHPVTTDETETRRLANQVFRALKKSDANFVVIYPNNDAGSHYIREAVDGLADHSRFRVFPSVRFEYFMTLLREASFIVGNSSCGVREAPVYRVPAINVGSRQNSRRKGPTIIDVPPAHEKILAAIRDIADKKERSHRLDVPENGTVDAVMNLLLNERIWALPLQKYFQEHV